MHKFKNIIDNLGHQATDKKLFSVYLSETTVKSARAFCDKSHVSFSAFINAVLEKAVEEMEAGDVNKG